MPQIVLYSTFLCYHKLVTLLIRKQQEPLLLKFGSCRMLKSVFNHSTHMLMITFNTDFDNPISQDSYDKTINHLQFHQLTCSCGHSACMTIHGYYDRSIKSGVDSVRLHICRVKCCHCHKTHALLPISIVPYSQVSFPDQAAIISRYEDSGDYSEIMNKTPSIDENCIHSIIRRYLLHWLQRTLSAFLSVSPSFSFVQLCFSHFSRHFMQVKRTPNILYLTPT